jgi:hypothetical protein
VRDSGRTMGFISYLPSPISYLLSACGSARRAARYRRFHTA